MGKCKSCVKGSVRENRRNRRQQYAEYERSRANLQHRVEARRKYQEEHKEEIAEYKKTWAEINAARMAAFKREYYERNREDAIARSEEWGRNNAEKVRQFKANNGRKRRAAKHASSGNFTAKEFEELCERYGNRCLCCGSEGVLLEADHVVPLSRGGSDDIGNIQPLCGVCNRSKFVRAVDYRTGGRELRGSGDLLGEVFGFDHLRLDESLVEGTAFQQLLVGALGRDPAPVEQQDPVGPHDGREPVGYHHDGASQGDLANRLL
jgi:5-methylcytosine-specific restriction endonuclease McrA